MNPEIIAEKARLKEKLSSLEQQEYNVNKMLKVLNDPDFDTYTFTIEASKETNGFKDKQTVKFYDFSTLPDALSKAMPSHLDMLRDLIKDTRDALNELTDEEQQETNEVTED